MLFSREVCSAFRGGIFEADLKAVKSSALPSDFLFVLWIFLDVCYNFQAVWLQFKTSLNLYVVKHFFFSFFASSDKYNFVPLGSP